MKQKHQVEAGVTLIEMIISLTIINILFTIIFSCFWTGFLIWKQGKHDINLYQSGRIAMETMLPEIRQGTDQQIFRRSGKQDKMSFYDAIHHEKIVYEKRTGELYRNVYRVTSTGTEVLLAENPIVAGVEDIRFCWQQDRKAIWIKLELKDGNQTLKIENTVFCVNKDINR